MRVFLAGSTGAMGRNLLPLLLESDHQVVALARSREKAAALEERGVDVTVADALDRAGLSRAIRDAEPEVVIHQLTSIPSVIDPKRLDEQFALTNRLRIEATDTILAAAGEAGVRRVVVQGFCGWPYARQGGPVKTEEDPFDPKPPASFRETLEAMKYLEYAVSHAEGVEALSLRYGFFYGSDTSISEHGPVVEAVRGRKMPIIGDGGGIWSFIHIRDAARATIAAMTRGAPGAYNVVDDEPAPVATWLPYLAEVLGAEPPHHVPAFLARMAVGEGGVVMMTDIRGASNAKAKRELGWEPEFASWRRGFVEGL